MDNNIYLYIILFGVFIIMILALYFIVRSYFKNPFTKLQIKKDFNISNKRQPSYEEIIDSWIIALHNDNKYIIDIYNNTVTDWKDSCEDIIHKSILWKKHRLKMFRNLENEICDSDYNIFVFKFYRNSGSEEVIYRSINQMIQNDFELSVISYSTTRKKSKEVNQRKLVTTQVRQEIKERDNYTCQICGISKQFLDDLCPGLGDYLLFEIDHVQSISNHGLSTNNNLQCLCWRCNRAKSGSKSNEEVKQNLTYGIDMLKNNLKS